MTINIDQSTVNMLEPWDRKLVYDEENPKACWLCLPYDTKEPEFGVTEARRLRDALNQFLGETPVVVCHT